MKNLTCGCNVDGQDRSRFGRVVVLQNWWVIKARQEIEGKRFGVAGFEVAASEKRQPTRLFTSAPIAKVYDVFTADTADGIGIILRGHINKERTLQSGFSSEIFECIVFGFPPNWEEVFARCYKGDCGPDTSSNCMRSVEPMINEGANLFATPCKDKEQVIEEGGSAGIVQVDALGDTPRLVKEHFYCSGSSPVAEADDSEKEICARSDVKGNCLEKNALHSQGCDSNDIMRSMEANNCRAERFKGIMGSPMKNSNRRKTEGSTGSPEGMENSKQRKRTKHKASESENAVKTNCINYPLHEFPFLFKGINLEEESTRKTTETTRKTRRSTGNSKDMENSNQRKTEGSMDSPKGMESSKLRKRRMHKASELENSVRINSIDYTLQESPPLYKGINIKEESTRKTTRATSKTSRTMGSLEGMVDSNRKKEGSMGSPKGMESNKGKNRRKHKASELESLVEIIRIGHTLQESPPPFKGINPKEEDTRKTTRTTRKTSWTIDQSYKFGRSVKSINECAETNALECLKTAGEKNEVRIGEGSSKGMENSKEGKTRKRKAIESESLVRINHLDDTLQESPPLSENINLEEEDTRNQPCDFGRSDESTKKGAETSASNSTPSEKNETSINVGCSRGVVNSKQIKTRKQKAIESDSSGRIYCLESTNKVAEGSRGVENSKQIKTRKQKAIKSESSRRIYCLESTNKGGETSRGVENSKQIKTRKQKAIESESSRRIHCLESSNKGAESSRGMENSKRIKTRKQKAIKSESSRRIYCLESTNKGAENDASNSLRIAGAKNEALVDEGCSSKRAIKRRLSFDAPASAYKRQRSEKKIRVSPESLNCRRSRSGRLLLSTLEFWRNQLPVYDVDRKLIGIEEASNPPTLSRGIGCRGSMTPPTTSRGQKKSKKSRRSRCQS